MFVTTGGWRIVLILGAVGCASAPADDVKQEEPPIRVALEEPAILGEDDVWIRLARTSEGCVVCEIDRVGIPQRPDRDRYEGGRGLPPGPDFAVAENAIGERSQRQPGGGVVVDIEAGVPWKYVVDIVEVVRRLEIDDIAFTQRRVAAP